MDKPRWWHIAVTVMSVVLTVMVIATDISFARKAGALITLGVFAVAWFTVGRRAFHSSTAALIYAGILILTIGTATAFYPVMAILQCVAYPMLWVIARSIRWAIITNVALAIAVGVGFWFSTNEPAQVVITAGLSLTFSLALGLWIARIADLSEERRQLLDELHSTQDRLAAASRETGIASERERLAREIHDTIAQDLTGLVLLAQQARRELGGGRTEAAAENVAMIEENARTALAETRALVAATAPVSLTAGGLADALERLASRFTRETGISVTVTGGSGFLDRDAEVVLLRCAQESLANVRKHSGAAAATLELSASDGSVRLVVADDGHGFDPTQRSDGFGLGGMRDRLALVGGSLDVSSTPRGTTLVATLPRGVDA